MEIISQLLSTILSLRDSHFSTALIPLIFQHRMFQALKDVVLPIKKEMRS
jgi:hypothetical protein